MLIADDVGSNELSTVLVVESLHGGILDAWELSDDSLHLLQLDAEAANLHLSVAAAYELYVSIRQIAHDVAGAIATLVFSISVEGILDIHLRRLLRTVQIAAAHLRSAHPQLTTSALRQAVAQLVDDVESQVVERLADGDVQLLVLHPVVSRKDGALRRSVAVVHLVVRRRIERRELLSTHGEEAQRVVVGVRGKLIAHLRRDERMGDLVLLEVDVQIGQVQSDVLADDVDAGSAGHSGIDVHHAGVEAVAGVGRHVAGIVELEAPLIPMAEGYDVAVFQLAALGHTRRATGVEHDEEVVGGDVGLHGLRGFGQTVDLLRQEHRTLVFIHQVSQLLVGDE